MIPATLLALWAGLTPQLGPAPQAEPATLLTLCGLSVPAPVKLPPAGSKPVFLAMTLCFDKQGGASLIDPQTYLFYIQVRPSEPSRDRWITYDDEVEQVILQDFRRLWDTRFLDDLKVEVVDASLANGVVARVVVFHLEERQRVKIVDYDGLTKISQSDVESKLKEKGVEVRLDSFVDAGQLRRIAGLVTELYAEKGYQSAEVNPTVVPIAGSPKTVHVTFRVTEGPRITIRDVEFLGNRALSDRTLGSALKDNKAQTLLSLVSGKGVYKAGQFEEDADRIVALYRDRGYIGAQVGQPDLRALQDSQDGRTRWVQLRIPVTEGKRYTIGELTFSGNTKVSSEALAALFKLRAGEVYNESVIRKGFEKAREIYGAGGYFEFTGYPDLKPHEDGPPIVDVTVRLQEGRQYFVNRITFAGNTYTRDDVIRRELMLVEAGAFNTEALKYSIRRINQLGFFKPLEGDAIHVEKTPGKDDRVDVELKVQEQNRNQISFGAGASQYEGFFGNASYTTSNFLGRGESATIMIQRGSRSSNYQLAFTEPFLFGRAISTGFTLYSRKLDYSLTSAAIDYSEVRNGTSLTAGLPVRRFTRLFATYGYEVINSATSEELEKAIASDQTTAIAFLGEGRYEQSSIMPALVFNTVDNPLRPRDGMKLTGSYQYAGGLLRGNTHFIRPEVEAILCRPVTRRTALGLRATAAWIWNYSTTPLPYYLRFFLGGDTQIRGTDIRTVGPLNASNIALGGTKYVLFNAEYYFDIATAVRALLFHDAGQAFDEHTPINLRQLRTSTGAELRVTLPVIGVPFRLIYAWNIYRDSFQPARTFKFGVGATF
jgi:outer membrane protein insertion porin family